MELFDCDGAPLKLCAVRLLDAGGFVWADD